MQDNTFCGASERQPHELSQTARNKNHLYIVRKLLTREADLPLALQAVYRTFEQLMRRDRRELEAVYLPGP